MLAREIYTYRKWKILQKTVVMTVKGNNGDGVVKGDSADDGLKCP